MEKSLLQVLVYKDKLQKSSSDLPKIASKMWDWVITKPFTKKDKLNQGKSQHKSNLFENHIQKPMERILDLLPYLYKFNDDKLDEIFNAQKIRPLLMELLKDHAIPDEFIFRNDFKTVELARLFTEIGLLLLQENNTKQSVQDNIDKIRLDFKEYMEQVKKSTIHEKKQFEHLKHFYCEFNYSSDFKNDMINKYKKYGFKPDKPMVIFPNIDGLPSELRGKRVPLWLAQYVNYEINNKLGVS